MELNSSFTDHEIHELLEEKYHAFNVPDFIPLDPVSIPHQFSKRENIEIAGFLAATIAWGNRASIVKNANRLIQLMDNDPVDFVMNFEASDLDVFNSFKHRTFQPIDCQYFLVALQNIYKNHGGLEAVFTEGFLNDKTIYTSLDHFYSIFFELEHLDRTHKHLASVARGSAAKRINMFLRWMVRADNHGVDFGLWKSIPSSALMLPLDVHTGNISRKLGLLTRKQNDWRAVCEVSDALRHFDSEDPIKYDFALFGMGAIDKF